MKKTPAHRTRDSGVHLDAVTRPGRTVMNLNRRAFLRKTAFAGGAVLCASYPFFIERYIIQVNRYRISVPRLPSAFEGFTMVHLTDLHYGPLVPFGLLKKVVERANSIPCDMIVCTGDYIHERNSKKHIDSIWPLISMLEAPSGVLSVLGNHDHWGDTERSAYWLDKTGQNMRHAIRKIERNGESVWFVGAGDLWEDHVDIDYLMKPVPKDDCRIVLAHNPDSADTMVKSKPDLVVSGHTHGGQVNIPFIGTPILPVKNKNYSFGLKRSIHDVPVFISRGIGWAIYPVRFNCFPEIAVLTLNKTRKEG
jgi:predicted MPP superfamily phosphohydrolase